MEVKNEFLRAELLRLVDVAELLELPAIADQAGVTDVPKHQ